MSTNPKHLLEIRISIVMRRNGYNFLTPLSEFQSAIQKLFNHEYNQDEIENAMHRIEETYVFTELNEEIEKGIIEIEEDI